MQGQMVLSQRKSITLMVIIIASFMRALPSKRNELYMHNKAEQAKRETTAAN